MDVRDEDRTIIQTNRRRDKDNLSSLIIKIIELYRCVQEVAGKDGLDSMAGLFIYQQQKAFLLCML